MTIPQRSIFVSVIAWLFIIFSGLGVFAMLMETLIFFLLPFDELAKQDMQSSGLFSLDIFISLMRGFVVIMLVISLWMLVSSIGLLLRRNWGRINIIILMIIGIIFQVLGLIGSLLLLFGGLFMADMPATSEKEFLQIFVWIMFGFSFLISLSIAVLYGWIIKKLISPAIKAEFVAISTNAAPIVT